MSTYSNYQDLLKKASSQIIPDGAILLCHSIRCTGRHVSYREMALMIGRDIITKKSIETQAYVFTDIEYYTTDLHIVMMFFSMHGIKIRFQVQARHSIRNPLVITCEEELFRAMLTNKGAAITLMFPLYYKNYNYLCSNFHITTRNEPTFTYEIPRDFFSGVYSYLGLETGIEEVADPEIESIFKKSNTEIYLSLGLLLRDIQYTNYEGFMTIQNNTLTPGIRTTIRKLDDTEPTGEIFGLGIVINAIVSNGYLIPITTADIGS